MSVKAFVDTNIVIYLYSVDEEEKRTQAAAALKQHDCVISTQTLNEFCNFCIKKWDLALDDVLLAIQEIRGACAMQYLSEDTARHALELRGRYGYAYYDCLMLASALESGCKLLLSEDMSDGQIIEGSLEIRNVFKR